MSIRDARHDDVNAIVRASQSVKNIARHVAATSFPYLSPLIPSSRRWEDDLVIFQ